MRSNWGTAAAGAIGGAVLAVAIVFAAAGLGLLPGNADRQVHAYLIAHPQVLAEAADRLQAQQEASEHTARQAALGKVGMKAYFDPRVAFVTGPANARTTFVEFFDYNCPYCRASVPAVRHFLSAHKKDARVAFIEFPIKGPQSTLASRAAVAARKQPDKYLAFHFMLMDEQEMVTEGVLFADAARAGLDLAKLRADMQDPSVDAAIASAHSLAAATKIDGTPAFIINGKMHEGAIDDATLRDLVKPS